MPNSFQASVSALKKIAPLLWLRFSLGYAELSGTHSSGLLHLYIALQASMQVATFEDIVLAIPRSFPIKALYFLFVAGFLASSSRGSCSNCSSPLQLLVSASSAANNVVLWKCWRSQCGNWVDFLSGTRDS
jgi:hypothetical protein